MNIQLNFLESFEQRTLLSAPAVQFEENPGEAFWPTEQVVPLGDPKDFNLYGETISTPFNNSSNSLVKDRDWTHSIINWTGTVEPYTDALMQFKDGIRWAAPTLANKVIGAKISALVDFAALSTAASIFFLSTYSDEGLWGFTAPVNAALTTLFGAFGYAGYLDLKSSIFGYECPSSLFTGIAIGGFNVGLLSAYSLGNVSDETPLSGILKITQGFMKAYGFTKMEITRWELGIPASQTPVVNANSGINQWDQISNTGHAMSVARMGSMLMFTTEALLLDLLFTTGIPNPTVGEMKSWLGLGSAKKSEL